MNTGVHILFWISVFIFFKYPEVELVDHMMVLFLIFWGTFKLFSTVSYSYQQCMKFIFSTSSPLVISCLFGNNPSSECEVISYRGFDLHFPDDEWCWASFYVPVRHLYGFLGKMLIHVLCPFFNWTVYFLPIELYEFFIYFRY